MNKFIACRTNSLKEEKLFCLQYSRQDCNSCSVKHSEVRAVFGLSNLRRVISNLLHYIIKVTK